MMDIYIKNIRDNYIRSHRKLYAPGLQRVYKVLDKDFKEIIDCRLYYSNNFNTCYCCCWIKKGNVMYECSGKASGCGYERQSAAVCIALSNGGITFIPNFWGAGLSEVCYALKELAKKVSGKRKVYLIDSHV